MSSWLVNTSWSTYRTTYKFLIPQCFIEGSPINISTSNTQPIELLTSGSEVLTMDTPFDAENALTLTSSFNMASGSINIEHVEHQFSYFVIGIVDFNNGLFKTTHNHPHIINRSGSWYIKRTDELQIGDSLYHKDGYEVPIISMVEDNENTYTVYQLDTEESDAFFVNGILTYNKES